MARWAELDENNSVIRVTIGDNAEPDGGHGWLVSNLGGRWIQTSYNTRGGIHYTTDDAGTRVRSESQDKALRFNSAGIGFTYDADRDAFIPPTPYVSWVLDEATCLWVAPIDYPADGGQYVWDEAGTDWVEVQDETP